MGELPPEIIFNILSRLPVKPLGQFKSVCKSWRSLITDPIFTKSHLKRAISDRPTILFTYDFTSRYPFYSLDYESQSAFADVLNIDEEEAIVSLDYPPLETKDGFLFMGSCDGLICMFRDLESIIVWNPSTNVYKEFPILTNAAYIFYGLGYSSSNGAYMVAIVFVDLSTSSSNKKIVQIINVATGSSCMVDGFENLLFYRVHDETGIFFNGAIHWLVMSGMYSGDSVLALDLVDEKLTEISIPEGCRSCLLGRITILDGFLSLFCYNFDNKDNMDIWVMKEYGSWTRMIVLCVSDLEIRLNMHIPVCFTKDGEIVIDLGAESLIKYNIKDRASRELKQSNEGQFFVCGIFVESLVSPHGDY